MHVVVVDWLSVKETVTDELDRQLRIEENHNCSWQLETLRQTEFSSLQSFIDCRGEKQWKCGGGGGGGRKQWKCGCGSGGGGGGGKTIEMWWRWWWWREINRNEVAVVVVVVEGNNDGSTKTRNLETGNRKGITETEYGICERRFQAINLKKRILEMTMT